MAAGPDPGRVAPSLLTVLAQEYPERSVEELTHVVIRAAQVASSIDAWPAHAEECTLTLARDRLEARRAREIAQRREKQHGR